MCASFLKPDTLTPHISTGQSTLGDGRSESTTKVAVIGAGGHAKVVISTHWRQPEYGRMLGLWYYCRHQWTSAHASRVGHKCPAIPVETIETNV